MEAEVFGDKNLEKLKKDAESGDPAAVRAWLELDKEKRRRAFREKLLNEEA